jgi:hypothetical protein
MLYTPLLPGAAAGTLEPRHVVVPLRKHPDSTELILGHVTGADPARDCRALRSTPICPRVITRCRRCRAAPADWWSRSPTPPPPTTPTTIAFALRRPRQDVGYPHRLAAGAGASHASTHRRSVDPGMDALGAHARPPRGQRVECGRRPSAPRTSAPPRPADGSARPSPRSPAIPTCRAGTDSRRRAGSSRRSTASLTSTEPARPLALHGRGGRGRCPGRRQRLPLTAWRAGRFTPTTGAQALNRLPWPARG